MGYHGEIHQQRGIPSYFRISNACECDDMMGLQTEEFTWNQNIVISNSKMISQRPCLVGVGVSMFLLFFCGMIMLSGIAQFQIRINSAVNLSAKGGTQQQ